MLYYNIIVCYVVIGKTQPHSTHCVTYCVPCNVLFGLLLMRDVFCLHKVM